MENKYIKYSAEELMVVPLEEVMAIPLEWLNEGYEPVTAVEREALFTLLGKPTGVGLPSGYMNNGPGIEELQVQLGDHVVENSMSSRGVGKLLIARLGSKPDIEVYEEQIWALGGEVHAEMSHKNEQNKVWKTVVIFKYR